MKYRVGLYRIVEHTDLQERWYFYTIKLNNGLYLDIHTRGYYFMEVDEVFPATIVYKALKVI